MAEVITGFRANFDILASSLRTTARGSSVGAAEFRAAFELGDGTGNNQVNKYWEGSGTIAASGNADLDLVGGLTDQNGNLITFTAVKVIAIVNTSALIATKLICGNTATTLFATTFLWPISKGGVFIWADLASGEPVVTTTGDLLRITNADAVNAATYEAFIAGTV